MLVYLSDEHPEIEQCFSNSNRLGELDKLHTPRFHAMLLDSISEGPKVPGAVPVCAEALTGKTRGE